MTSKQEIEICSPQTEADTLQKPLEIERVLAADISYDQFFIRFMQTNTAVILTGVSDHWECFRRWVLRNERGVNMVDVSYLKARIENVPVPVADCSKQYYDTHAKLEMNFHSFLDYWDDENRKDSDSKLYLKDWHLRELLPEYYFYETPAVFASDWLNEYLLDRKENDYMFVYIGAKETWTAFHADVFASYSWSTNIFGVKMWLLLPPGEEIKLKDLLGNLPFEISEEMLGLRDVAYYKIFQTAGEAIFVPSGWYHQVQNVDDTISVNHNWFNGCNIESIWLSLDGALSQVIKEIEDCRDMDNFDEHCQLMLKASYGMNLEGFLDILMHVCDKRVQAFEGNVEVIHFERFRLGKNHVRFDIEAIRHVLTLMLVRSPLLESLQLLTKIKDYIHVINASLS